MYCVVTVLCLLRHADILKQQASGAFGFLACLAGWWIFLAQMFNAVDFPVQLPMGDISHVIKGGTVRAHEKTRLEGQEVYASA